MSTLSSADRSVKQELQATTPLAGKSVDLMRPFVKLTIIRTDYWKSNPS